jgi:hypothetical protein
MGEPSDTCSLSPSAMLPPRLRCGTAIACIGRLSGVAAGAYRERYRDARDTEVSTKMTHPFTAVNEAQVGPQLSHENTMGS